MKKRKRQSPPNMTVNRKPKRNKNFWMKNISFDSFFAKGILSVLRLRLVYKNVMLFTTMGFLMFNENMLLFFSTDKYFYNVYVESRFTLHSSTTIARVRPTNQPSDRTPQPVLVCMMCARKPQPQLHDSISKTHFISFG